MLKREVALVAIIAFFATTVKGQTEPDICYEMGDCRIGGLFEAFFPASDYNECLDECEMADECNYATYYEAQSECGFWKTCPQVSSSSCTHCYTGNENCTRLPDLICNEPGTCTGILIPTDPFNIDVGSPDACLQLCKDDVDQKCQWWEYQVQGPDDICILYETCEFAPQSPDLNIYVGQVDCESENPPQSPNPRKWTKLMVVSGYPGPGNYISEFIDLSGTTTSCPPVTNFPVDQGGTGTYFKGQGLVCGGGSVGSKKIDNCYTYDITNRRWDPATPMLTTRNGCRSVHLNTDPDEWWVSGDGDPVGSNPTLYSTEVLRDGEAGWIQFPGLPKDVDHHALVRLDGEHVIMMGGMQASNEVFLFTRTLGTDTGTWTDFPPMQTARAACEAGLVTFRDPNDGSVTKQWLVAVSGNGESSVEYYDLAQGLTNGVWQYTTPLPTATWYGASVDYRDSLIIVGGTTSGGQVDTVWFFNHETDPDNIRWEEVAQLSVPRQSLSAFMVPDDYAQCT